IRGSRRLVRKWQPLGGAALVVCDDALQRRKIARQRRITQEIKSLLHFLAPSKAGERLGRRISMARPTKSMDLFRRSLWRRNRVEGRTSKVEGQGGGRSTFDLRLSTRRPRSGYAGTMREVLLASRVTRQR